MLAQGMGHSLLSRYRSCLQVASDRLTPARIISGFPATPGPGRLGGIYRLLNGFNFGLKPRQVHIACITLTLHRCSIEYSADSDTAIADDARAGRLA